MTKECWCATVVWSDQWTDEFVRKSDRGAHMVDRLLFTLDYVMYTRSKSTGVDT